MSESHSYSNDTESIDSTPNEVKQFNPIDDVEAQENAENLSQHLSRILSTPEGIQKIQSLARVLSTKTKADLDHFEVNPQDFDLKLLLKYLHERAADQGIESAHSGLAFKDIHVGVSMPPQLMDLLFQKC